MVPPYLSRVTDMLLHNSNQFASGGFLLMIIGGIAAYFRQIPNMIYEWILHLFSMTLTINDDSKAFLWFKWWFHEHPRSKKIRHVDVSTPRGELLIFPAPGNHWFTYKGRPFRMNFSRSADDKGSLRRESRPESLVLRVLGRDQKFLREFVEDIQTLYAAHEAKQPLLWIWSGIGSYWDDMKITLRPWDSVILPADLKNDFVKDIENFKASEAWYLGTGLPYHRSYLLHGPPGTGKTSTLLGLASHFNSDIYLIKLSGLNDESLLRALHEVPRGGMVVMEDVDCLDNKRESLKAEPPETTPGVQNPDVPLRRKGTKKVERDKKKDNTGITLSGILNALDGVETPSGSMFFLTTNLIQNLDEALLRPGRIDKKIYLGPATDDQKLEMYHRFFPDQESTSQGKTFENEAEIFVMNHPELRTMAEFQEALKLKRSTL